MASPVLPTNGVRVNTVVRTLAPLALALCALPVPLPAGAEEMPTILLGQAW